MSFPDPKEYAKRTSQSPKRRAYTEQWVKRVEEAVMDLKNWKDGRLCVGIAYDRWHDDMLDPERRKAVIASLVSKGYHVQENATFDGREEVETGFLVTYPEAAASN